MKQTLLISILILSLTLIAVAEPGDENAVPSHFKDHNSLLNMPIKDIIEHGSLLFMAKFTTLDGAGRPTATQASVPTKRRADPSRAFFRTSGPESNACVSCHRDPLPGGSGGFVLNVFTTSGFVDADFDSMDPQFSNERGTTNLFGSGLVELLAREMTADLHRLRDKATSRARSKGQSQTVDLVTKGISFGRLTVTPQGFLEVKELEGIDPDLVVRPFSQKGVFVSIREFTINASNSHHGMQAAERFGARWTGEDDFDHDGKILEMSEGDVSALVLFQATLPPPGRLKDLDRKWKTMADSGEKLFSSIGCASCHTPELPLDSLQYSEPGPYNAAGNLRASEADLLVVNLIKLKEFQHLRKNAEGKYLVPIFSDLKRHTISDGTIGHFRNELLGQRFADRDQFLSGRLWGVASTGPWGHRGDLTTLTEVIQAHGGEARISRNQFQALSEIQRKSIIAFLQTLVIQ